MYVVIGSGGVDGGRNAVRLLQMENPMGIMQIFPILNQTEFRKVAFAIYPFLRFFLLIRSGIRMRFSEAPPSGWAFLTLQPI